MNGRKKITRIQTILVVLSSNLDVNTLIIAIRGSSKKNNATRIITSTEPDNISSINNSCFSNLQFLLKIIAVASSVAFTYNNPPLPSQHEN